MTRTITIQLNKLIQESRSLADPQLCSEGHTWERDGGRSCPKSLPVQCSQTVYSCAVCGEQDYGNKGGPAYTECFVRCSRTEEDL